VIVNLGAFVGVSAAVIVAPGLDTALITRNALLHGRRSAAATALGVNTGMLVWTIATAAGLAALVRASAVAFTVIKFAGAAYLIWIGLRMLAESRRATAQRSQTQVLPARAATAAAGYRQGLICNISNPKAAIVFTSLLPQFIAGHRPSAGAFLALGAIFVALAIVLDGVYAVLAARASRRLAGGRVRAWIDRVTGIVLVGLGVRLLTERR